MIYRIADNVVSPLGMTTAENFQALKAGRSALCRYEHHWGLPETFTASLFSEAQNRELHIPSLTRFESLAVRSVQDALQQTTLDVAASNVIFILSTTKANIELLGEGADPGPAAAAERIARYLGFTTQPLVVCNACISGVSAIVLAERLLDAGIYDYAVVCGADVQNPFTVSGFQSLKAVAEDDCRPFDLERLGLNLGEAAATIVFQRQEKTGCWAVERGAVRNDGYHISAPSKNGEGARMALEAIGVEDIKDQLAFINAHGTATMFNDQMESVAIARAGLQEVPVNALKGYFGHTLGAAGVLETVLSIAATDDHTILGTRGFEELGVSGKIRLSSQHTTTNKQSFIKMISGFGGGNGAIVVSKAHVSTVENRSYHVGNATFPRWEQHDLLLQPSSLKIDNEPVAVTEQGMALLTALYKQRIGDYPKYYKMDALSRLGFVASELLLQAAGDGEEHLSQHTAVILFNRSSSIVADRQYQASIGDADFATPHALRENFFPSPSVFVYTLPNIVTGEIALRHGWHSETSFYILGERNDELMRRVVSASLAECGADRVLTGWIDYEDDQHFVADLHLIVNNNN